MGKSGKKSFGIGLVLVVVAFFALMEVFAATTTTTDVSTAASTLLNVTAENNFSHLTTSEEF